MRDIVDLGIEFRKLLDTNRNAKKRIADNAKRNPKMFWQYVNKRTKTMMGICKGFSFFFNLCI